jgi:hypothetical protein
MSRSCRQGPSSGTLASLTFFAFAFHWPRNFATLVPCAVSNRQEWEAQGQEVVASMLKKYEGKRGCLARQFLELSIEY